MKGNIGYSIGILIVILIIISFSVLLSSFFSSPFKYPYFKHTFNVSGKKLPNMEDYIDTYIIEGKFYHIQQHQEAISEWKELNCKAANNSIFRKRRIKQFQETLDDDNAYIFSFSRNKTRYRQKNYRKFSYETSIIFETKSYNYEFLKDRYDKLEAINFACPLRAYDSKKQRSLMTKDLRRKICKRDNYTCQNCGKYMPDGVGLHIDHIIPISKGGKTIESNLQVLCSKCNLSKSNKILY